MAVLATYNHTWLHAYYEPHMVIRGTPARATYGCVQRMFTYCFTCNSYTKAFPICACPVWHKRSSCFSIRSNAAAHLARVRLTHGLATPLSNRSSPWHLKPRKTVSFYGAEHFGTADPSVPWVETSIASELATPSTMIRAAPQTRVATPLSTVVRTSDMQPGQILTGHVVDLQTGERRSAHDADKRMYLMPWGEALIGVDPATRKRLDFACALAWEHDVAFVRSMRTSIDAEGLIGSLGRHPLTPPLDYGRLGRFERSQVMGLLKSPFEALFVCFNRCA